MAQCRWSSPVRLFRGLMLNLVVTSVFALGCSPGILADSLIEVNFPGAASTYVQGINNSGQVVGSFVTSPASCNSCNVSFVRNADGTYSSFIVPGAFSTTAIGINNAGEIVGSYFDGANGPGNTQAFIDLGGQFTTVSVPGSLQTEAYGVNDLGQVVGSSEHNDADLDVLGFLRNQNGTITQFQAPGGDATVAEDINDEGQIVGWFRTNSGDTFGFMLNPDGSFTPIDVPGSTGTYAYGINDFGQIVGYFDSPTGTHGFIDTGGIITAFDLGPGCVVPLPGGINDFDQISGACESDTTSGFIATPADFVPVSTPPISAPEPSSRSLLATGLAGLMAMIWCKKRPA
jgi:probable HAF family extracellular repeat protein